MRGASSVWVLCCCVCASVGDVRYTKDHEWVRVTKAGEATIGITDFAQVSDDTHTHARTLPLDRRAQPLAMLTLAVRVRLCVTV